MLDPLLKDSIDLYWLRPNKDAVEIYSAAMSKAGVRRFYRYPWQQWADEEYHTLIDNTLNKFYDSLLTSFIGDKPEGGKQVACLKEICMSYFSKFKNELTINSVQSALDYINEKFQEISESALQATNRYYKQEWISIIFRLQVRDRINLILKKLRENNLEPLALGLKLLAKEEQQKRVSLPVTEPPELGAGASNEAGNIENNRAILNLPSIENWSDLCLGDATALEIYISKKGHKGRNYSYVELHLGDKRRNSAKIPSKTWHAIRYYAFGAGKEHDFKKTDLLRANQALSRLFPSLHNIGNPFPISKSGLRILKQDALSRRTVRYNDDYGGQSEQEYLDEADEKR